MDTSAGTQIPIAIIGAGCLFPGAADLRAFWSNILNRVDAVTEVPPERWDPTDYFNSNPGVSDQTYGHRGAFLSPVDFSPLEFGITPKSLEATETTQLLGLMVAKAALEDAGYAVGPALDGKRVSVVLGVTGTQQLVIPLGARLGHPIWRKALREAGVDANVAADVIERIADSYVEWQEDSFPGLLGNVVAGRIANRLNLHGTNCIVDAACGSSLGALHLAVMELAAGRCELALSGGVDTFNDIFMYMCFSKTPALSPTGDARPFDVKGDGTVLGEGLGCLVLKRLADAERDGDRIFAVIRAIGTSSDGKGNAIYAPSPEGQVRALRNAYELAGVSPASVELIEAHGTGTRAGDTAETKALVEVFGATGRKGHWCALGSVKSQIGHTKAAAGAAGVLKAALALHHKVLPPTIKVSQPIETLQAEDCPLYVNADKRPWLPNGHSPRRAAVSSFGFGGSNFHCVLEEHRPEKAETHWDGDVQIAAFSVGAPAQLQQPVTDLLGEQDWQTLRLKASRSRDEFRLEHPCRLVLVLQRGQNLRALAEKLGLLWQSESNVPAGTLPADVYFAQGGCQGKLAMLFPGQGSQYPGMLRDLACQFPNVQDILAEASACFAQSPDLGRTDSIEPAVESLGDLIYPRTSFTAVDQQRNSERLTNTRIAQPALGAVSLAAFRLLGKFGVRGDYLAGHSFGELTALCAGGRLTDAEFFRLANLRGRLMSETASPGGGMLAVALGADELARLLRTEKIRLTIANHNGPQQTVLSGEQTEIERATSVLQKHGVVSRPLSVSAAFHSPLMLAALQPFGEGLRHVSLLGGRVPVFANVTGHPYPGDPELSRELLCRQLVSPVLFEETVRELNAAGTRTFLEVGPGNKLTGLVRAILGNQPHLALACDASAGRNSGQLDLARVLAALAAEGHPIALCEWDPVGASKCVTPSKPASLTVQLTGANYRSPKDAKRPAQANACHRPIVREEQKLRDTRPALPASNGAAKQSVAEAQPSHGTDHRSNDHLETQRLDLLRQSLLAVQSLSEQTAQLHRQFLEGQDRALQVMQELLQLPTTQGPALPPTTRPTIAVLPGTTSDNGKATESVSIHTRVQASMPDQGADPEPRHASSNGSTVRPAAEAAPISRASTDVLFQVVAEKTGYPAETLALDMELDVDLGIDSIKRVEILSALQERLPTSLALESSQFGTLRSLRDVAVALELDLDPHLAGVADTIRTESSGSTSKKAEPELADLLIRVIAEKTGYPPDMLSLEMELDADLGIDSIKRVEILSALQQALPDNPALASGQISTHRTLREVLATMASEKAHLGVDCAHSQCATPTTPVPEQACAQTALQCWSLTTRPLDTSISRVPRPLSQGARIWIIDSVSPLGDQLAERLRSLGFSPQSLTPDAALSSAEEMLDALVFLSPVSGTDDDHLFKAFQILQKAGPALRSNAEVRNKAVLSVSRLDGGFGCLPVSNIADPLSGGLFGLIKTVALEWPEVSCKALDLATDFDETKAAAAITDELQISGPLEVGINETELLQPELTVLQTSRVNTEHLKAGDVVLISGGARGITAEAALALARTVRLTIVLVGRSAIPSTEPAWLSQLTTEAEIKQQLFQQSSQALPPRELERQYREILAGRQIRKNLERIRSVGGTVTYRQADVRDFAALESLVCDVRGEYGPVSGLIHGAGVIEDRRIEDKTLEQFQAVYNTKVVGLRNLLAVLKNDPVKMLVLFSSSTARFGRAGQVDYAVANEVLNKLAQAEARRRRDCHVQSINWGPWAGGMVHGGLQRLFHDEGIGLIGVDDGARLFAEKLIHNSNKATEVVVLANSPQATPAESTSAATQMRIAHSRQISVKSCPVLQSHVIGDRAVVPLVLHLEWLAHGAVHANPGLHFHGFDDLRILQGVKLDVDDEYTLDIVSAKPTRQNGYFRVAAEIQQCAKGRTTIHSRATIVLATKLPVAPIVPATAAEGCSYSRPIAEAYASLLFHGPDLQGLRHIDCLGPDFASALVATAPPPGRWLARPLRSTWLADPLVLDCSLQLMLLWSWEHHGTPMLPTAIGTFRQYCLAYPHSGVRVNAGIVNQSKQHVEVDIEFVDEGGKLLARLERGEWIRDISLTDSFQRNRLSILAHSS